MMAATFKSSFQDMIEMTEVTLETPLSPLGGRGVTLETALGGRREDTEDGGASLLPGHDHI